jgi:hypothetical protein
VFAAAVVAEVKALACELPTQTEVPLARWSCPELTRISQHDRHAPQPLAA